MESPAFYWKLFIEAGWDRWEAFYWSLEHFSMSDEWLIPLWIPVGLCLVERFKPWRREQRQLRPGLGVDVFYFMFNWMLVWLLFGWALQHVVKVAFSHAVMSAYGVSSPVLIPLDGMQLWARFALFLLFQDFVGYWLHVLMHRVGFLWEFHKVHHSSQRLDVWNAQRFHFVELVFVGLLAVPGFVLVGWPVEDVFGYLFVGGLISNILSCFTHANVRIPLGPFRYILNSPQFHLWHHARAQDARENVNYGDALSVWDYLFRTDYMPDERADLQIGFEGDEDYPKGFFGQLVAPFAALFRRRAAANR